MNLWFFCKEKYIFPFNFDFVTILQQKMTYLGLSKWWVLEIDYNYFPPIFKAFLKDKPPGRLHASEYGIFQELWLPPIVKKIYHTR